MTALYAAIAVAVPVLAFVALIAYQGRRIDRRDLTPYTPLEDLMTPPDDPTRVSWFASERPVNGNTVFVRPAAEDDEAVVEETDQ